MNWVEKIWEKRAKVGNRIGLNTKIVAYTKHLLNWIPLCTYYKMLFIWISSKLKRKNSNRNSLQHDFSLAPLSFSFAVAFLKFIGNGSKKTSENIWFRITHCYLMLASAKNLHISTKLCYARARVLQHSNAESISWIELIQRRFSSYQYRLLCSALSFCWRFMLSENHNVVCITHMIIHQTLTKFSFLASA